MASQYIVYCLLGLADGNSQIFLWPQWERAFYLFDPLLKPYEKTSSVKSDLVYVIPLKARKGDLPGTQNVTFKGVPLGRLRWNYEHNKKWSEKVREKGEYPIRFLDAQILSSNHKTNPPDVQLFIASCDSVPGAPYNQLLTLCIEESVFAARPADYWQGLIRDSAALLKAVRIGRTRRPWWMQRPRQDGLIEGSSLANANFSQRYDSLDLEDSWQTWEYLTV